MFYYILCSTPCAVKLNGEYVGRAAENYSIIDLSAGLVEFLPIDATYAETAILLGGKEKSEPHRLFDLGKNAKLIIPAFKRKMFSDFKLLKRFDNDFRFGKVYTTCYAENGVRLIVENERDMNVQSLPFSPSEIVGKKVRVSGAEYLVVFLIGKRTMILAYKITDKIRLAFKNVCDSYKANDDLLTLIDYKSDTVKHSISTVWKFGETVKAVSREVKSKRQVFELPEKLFPYAFMEELIAGGDVSDYLAARLKPRAEDLKLFLGNFTMVLPPPHFAPNDYLLLLYPDRVKYARLTFEKRLIDGVSLLDADEI